MRTADAPSKTLSVTPTRRNPLIAWWFAVSTVVVFYDVSYCLTRPHSFYGGKWHWLWTPYALYEKIDLVYSPSFYERGEGFTSAQALLNLVENGFNIAYLWLSARNSPISVLVGFTGVVCTFWKTVLYWLQDQQCGWCLTGHNTRRDWWLLFALPNGFWIVVPGLIAWVFAKEIAAGLRAGAKQKLL